MLNLFNADLPWKSYWRESWSQKVGEEGDYFIPNTALSPPEWSCVKMGSDESRFNVLLIAKGKVTKRMSVNHNFLKEMTAEAESNRGPSAYQLTPYRGPNPAQ